MSETAPSGGAPPPVAWEELLANHPPDKERQVSDMGQHMQPRGPSYVLNAPDLSLHCSSKTCRGIRVFRCVEHTQQLAYNSLQPAFLLYQCRNCRETVKRYAVLCVWRWTLKTPPRPTHGASGSLMRAHPAPPVTVQDVQQAVKLGEWPPLGPPLPTGLSKLVEHERTLFDLGRRAEGQGMGIGAFAYYRRVVEAERAALFDKLIAAAERLKVDPEVITALKEDRDKWQFSQSVAKLKGALPEQLKVQGQNPMALLHNALSHNLHNESDEICLQTAKDIRVVLTYFADQLDAVLKDQAELEKAVGRLSRAT